MRRQHYSTLMSADFTIGLGLGLLEGRERRGVPPFCRPLVVSGLMPE